MNQTLIIAGMHRSGTSLITNWLNRCGMQIGERLCAGSESNIDGHFEDVEFLKLHEEILDCNSLDISGLVDKKHIEIPLYQLEKLKAIIGIKQQLFEQWAWKDPRTCLFLDTYTKLLPNAKYLVITRNFQSVVSSLLRREFAYVDKKYMARSYIQRLAWTKFRRKRRREAFWHEHAATFLKIWINYNEEILRAIKKLQPDEYLVTNYAQLLENDNEVFSFLTGKWNLSLNYFDFKDVYKQELMGKAEDISDYVEDKSLLIKATYLVKRLNSHMRGSESFGGGE
ncbi:sulfotransferase family protein [Mucilaginibacter oryzae]|uniref:Sulfotransferase family protein n=1 Tax=Mucilaginibacter oryzae TaxID=468058 RepID=A0A316H2U0_9SPHI|nr:sulfotransferase [Mucilaginibacter oryzae]PWK73781.1 sulfotransferase family protein [Mucilaginibacter oryzae]